jgi:hypothetical protein
MVDYLEQVLEYAAKKLSNDQRDPFLRAVQMSTHIDVDYLEAHQKQFPLGNRKASPVLKPRRRTPVRPNISSIEQIQIETGFDAKDMAEFRIALTRPEAYEYLSTLTSLKRTVFEKDFTIDSYKQKFGVDPFDMGRKRLLLTYAQWIHFMGLPVNPRPPGLGNGLVPRQGGDR